ncbi:uncharacterized protein Tco025E_03092 [Trypanosoma conorhini]|uniref:Ataxin-10 domain-containing protein n=1 Tax=Trypanosoma conorhini TaxID=83891 RepID=A0A3R7L7P6_9TRYP|nr:uncharacterized protein Tco025E_03092 [Trypanosoma conorhini]RNF22699.1 hypothetical protein Tco025E_03092 [Trypanosoma conorhini]
MNTSKGLLALVEALERMTANAGCSPPREPKAAKFRVEDIFGTPTSSLGPTAAEEEVFSRGGTAPEVHNGDTFAASVGDSGIGGGPSDAAAPVASLREMAIHFGRNKPHAGVDLHEIFSLLRKLIDSTHSTAECAHLTCMGPDIDKATKLIKPVALADVRAAVYMLSLCSNLAAVKESRLQLNAPLVLDFVLTTVQAHIAERHVLYVALVALSHLAYMEDARLRREDCELLSRLIYPVYTEAELVETWAVMICNVTAHHPETVQTFIELGVVQVLERLVIYFGEDGKTVIRCLQCLSNLAMGFTGGHPSAMAE